MRACLMVTGLSLAVLFGTTQAQAQCPPGGTGPDVVVGFLQSISNYNSQSGGGVTMDAFSIGTTSCNVGTSTLNWIASNNQHPVIGQNMFRLQGGVLEQIGQGWLKHGFCALSLNECGCGCASTNCSTLGVGCSDPYTSGRNGNQSNLGPRSQVNPSTGFYPYPPANGSGSGSTWKRVQVPTSLLSASSGDGITSGVNFFVDGQYIAPDDTAAGNGMNNVSVRKVNMSGSGTGFNASVTGPTIQTVSMIEHWQTLDPTVEVTSFDTDGGDGRIFVASKVIDLGGGQYHYEYAIYNMNSHDSVGGFAVPLPSGLTIDTSNNFHAVHHHSGTGGFPGTDPAHAGDSYNNSVWPIAAVPGADVSWTTASVGSAANPIRWGTMYNFRFVAGSAPVDGQVNVTTWRTDTEFTLDLPVPSGDFLPPVANLSGSFDLVEDDVDLAWTNGDSYTAIEIYRDGALLDTIAGGMTMYSDLFDVPGDYVYGVKGIQGAGAAPTITVDVNIPEPTLNFGFALTNGTVTFDPGTGEGSGSTTITVTEDPDNDDFPNQISGLSIAFTYDPALLEVTGVTQSSALTAIDPDFVEAAVLEDGGSPTGGVTIGVIVDFTLAPPLFEAATETEAFTVELGTNPAGATETSTSIFFEDGVHGPFPIDNFVTIGTDSYFAIQSPAVITLEVGNLFQRSDTNGDGSTDIADAVFDLTYQFQGGATFCLKAHDSNDDGAVDIADSVYTLNYLFQSGPEPVAPFGACGSDPTDDSLSCDGYPSC